MMQSWVHVWRKGLAPLLSDNQLQALRKGLAEDDIRLVQGATTQPPPLQCVQDWPCEAACATAYPGWIGDELKTVGEVEEFFAKMCYAMDQNLGEPAGCRWFLNWFDDTPRDEMRRELLVEVDRTIQDRAAKAFTDCFVEPDAVVWEGKSQ